MARRTGVFRRGLVEFVVIVVGVLVALGLESWWQGRQERVLEAEYLESLQTELRRNLASIESVSDVSELKRSWLERARIILEAGLVADSAGIFLEGALQGSGVPVVPQVSDAVFQDLVSTGRLALIRDDLKRRTIVRIYSFIETMLERRDRGNTNLGSELHALASRHAPTGVVQQIGPRIRVVHEPERLPEIRRAAVSLAADPTLPGEVRVAFRVLMNERNVLDQLDVAFQDLLAVLEGRALPDRGSFQQIIEADSQRFNTIGSTDSAGTR